MSLLIRENVFLVVKTNCTEYEVKRGNIGLRRSKHTFRPQNPGLDLLTTGSPVFVSDSSVNTGLLISVPFLEPISAFVSGF